MRRNGLGRIWVGAVAVQALAVVLYWALRTTTIPTTTTGRRRKGGGGGDAGSARHGETDMPLEFDPHRLRLNYSDLALRSPLARLFKSHQSDCSLSVADFRYRNRYGLGSDLHVWTQALCNAVQIKVRIRTEVPWIYVDAGSCQVNNVTTSAMGCYFPHAEPACPNDVDENDPSKERPKLYTGNGVVSRWGCDDVRQLNGNASLSDVRASGVEFLFSGLSPLVVHEAERQLRMLFGGSSGTSPSSLGPDQHHPSLLITVHIRWGDKRREDRPRPVSEYVNAVQQLLANRSSGTNEDPSSPTAEENRQRVGIFLATEDPEAVQQFQREAIQRNWTVFVDVYYQEFSAVRDGSYNGNPRMAQNLQGRPGLVALASLLVALQANDFVLTTSSNWSRLLNELRKNVLDPRCNNCTRMVDLSPGEW